MYSTSSSLVPVLEGDDSPGNLNASVVLNCTSSGTYYVLISGSNATIAGSYNLSVIASVGPDSYEVDSVPKLARSISTSAQSRSLTEGDVDWVSCNIVANDTVLLTANGTCRTVMALYDRDSATLLATAPVADSIAQIKYRVASSGTYFYKSFR